MHQKVEMQESLTLELTNRQQAWAELQNKLHPFLKEALQTGKRWILTVKPETRSAEQNRLQWPILSEFAKQLQWPINGQMVYMDAEDWKDLLTAAFHGETVRMAMGLNGGVVMLGQRTSKFSKAQFSEWIEFLLCVAAERGVKLPALDHDEQS